jgi:hypothetical protein
MISSMLVRLKCLCLIHFLLLTRYVHWLFRKKSIIFPYLPPLTNLYPLWMLLIHVNLKEEVEVTPMDSDHLDIAHFVVKITIPLNIAIRSMNSLIFQNIILLWMPQVVLLRLRHNQEVAVMLLLLLVSVFPRRSMISFLVCYNKWICFRNLLHLLLLLVLIMSILHLFQVPFLPYSRVYLSYSLVPFFLSLMFNFWILVLMSTLYLLLIGLLHFTKLLLNL